MVPMSLRPGWVSVRFGVGSSYFENRMRLLHGGLSLDVAVGSHRCPDVGTSEQLPDFLIMSRVLAQEQERCDVAELMGRQRHAGVPLYRIAHSVAKPLRRDRSCRKALPWKQI